jgi:protease I
MKRVLVLTGDGGEGLEIYYALFRLREEGHTAEVAAPSARPVQSVMHDFDPDWDTYVERPGYRVPVNLTFEQVEPAQYDGLVIPGGRAPEYIRNRPAVQQIVRHFFEANKPVGAICHGVQVLAAALAAGGRTVTCYQEIACEMTQAGADYEDRPVVVDGNLVTSRTWADNPEWMREFLKLLGARS